MDTRRNRYGIEDGIGCSRRRMEYGDRIFARLSMHGHTLVEFMVNRVSDMTELIGEIRKATVGKRGLATLSVRNQSKGWSMERPFMLYAPSAPSNPLFSPAPSASSLFASQSNPLFTPTTGMSFPWETH